MLKSTGMESYRQPAAAVAVAISKVLDDDDLLIEILLRVGFSSILVRASLVCKRWLGHVSDRAFLRRFRELHPPRLLGFYIEEMFKPSPAFVPILPQPPELSVLTVRERFSFKDYEFPLHKLHIHECRNGNVLIQWYDQESRSVARLHNPLCPRGGLTILPSLPRPGLVGKRYFTSRQVISQDGDDGLSYLCLHVESTLDAQESEFCVKVYMLQDGSWHETLHILHMGKLPHPRADLKAVLIDNKLYIPAGPSEIIILDLTASSLSTIQLPPGVDHRQRGTTLLSQADDVSGVYLIHAFDFQLRVWLHKGDNWILVDTICLREMCDNLKKSGCTIEDEHTPLLMSQVVDYGDFLFLRMGGCVLHLDIKSRTLRKVYETENGWYAGIYPFLMIWRPTFPSLKYGPARKST